MITRPEGLDLRRSLRAALGNGDAASMDAVAERQERTIDAILQRLYDDDEQHRREMVVLADEVGLGKTFVALGVAWSVLRQRRAAGLAPGPVLVVTPHGHALFNKWRREVEVFLKHVAPPGHGFAVAHAETPVQLAHELSSRRPKLVIARMSAFTGRLREGELGRRAVLHSLLRMPEFELSPRARHKLLVAISEDATPEALDLRRSELVWRVAQNELGFGDVHVRKAWRRLEGADPGLCKRVRDSWRRIRHGGRARSDLKSDLIELGRASLGQTARYRLPLVIVDEVHNWKNHPGSWRRFQHTIGRRTERLLGISATPFQLGPHELIQVFDLRTCIDLPETRASFLDERIGELGTSLNAAKDAGGALRAVWAEVVDSDLNDLEHAWPSVDEAPRIGSLLPRLQRAILAAIDVRDAHARLTDELRPLLIRNRRTADHRVWWVGCDAALETTTPNGHGSGFRYRHGLDVRGDAELVHYLMMRGVQEQKQERGTTSLGADLGGSYEFFGDGELRRMLAGRSEAAKRYLDLVERAIQDTSHEHPKVTVTADRAFKAWIRGEKTLIFCFNVRTVEAVRDAVSKRIEKHSQAVLTEAFGCVPSAVDQRLRNLQSRLYDRRQALFLLFQDHPLAGPEGRLRSELALRSRDLTNIAVRLAQGGPPRDRSRFDRRRVLAATEQTLISRWQELVPGRKWLDEVLRPLGIDATSIMASDWPARRRLMIEGIVRDAEVEALPEDDGDVTHAAARASAAHVEAWSDVLKGRAGRAVLAPYLADTRIAVPSLLTRWHSGALAKLPFELRALAARMLRRLVRSHGFLARFILSDPEGRPAVDDDAADESDWTSVIHNRYETPPSEGEAARTRFAAYLEELERAIGLPEQIAAYVEASKNRDVVARVTGAVRSLDRDRLFSGFNSPLVPEVLVVNSVGQEGIDLHRECRHVVHHDLPWNPATLEQRTGRTDRIGSKSERLRIHGSGESAIHVAVPYLAATYDEHRFRVVHGRAHLFEVTMGGDYVIDGFRNTGDDEGEPGDVWAPVPESIAADLRLKLAT